jgi:hypothetical protein
MKPSGLFGEPQNSVHCLLVRDSLFIRAESPLTRASIGQMSDLAKTHGASVLYAATYRQTPDFLKTVKLLLFVGFKQVDPVQQKALFKAPGVLLTLSL